MQTSFWLTTSCNMKCVYCYEGKNKKNKKMDNKIIDKALDLVIRHMNKINDKYLWIVLHGGEPFMAFHEMQYLVSRAKNLAKEQHISISFSATSNGTLLNDEMISFIKEEIDDFTISMDGNEETQDYSRPFENGKPTFEIVNNNMRKILEVKPDLRIRMTYNHQTVNNLFENVKYFMDLGVHCIVPVYDFYDQNFTNDDLEVLNQEIKKICEVYKQNEELLNNWKLQKLGECSGGITSMHIDTQGYIYPCMLAVGNNEFVIGDIYNGIDKKKRDQILKYSRYTIPKCEGCDLYKYCNETRCKIVNKVLNGNYLKPSPLACGVERIKYRICMKE